MAFHTQSDQEMMSEINVTPLVDVMLVLLVVFIVTAPLLSQSLEVKLPKTAAVQTRMDTKQQVITIDVEGKIALDSVVLSDEKLAQQLADSAAGKDDFELHVHADEAVPYGRVAQIMAIAQHAGVSKLPFMTMAGQ
ncbi:MAG: biopolymer transporter ExbD [Gallionella sp.]|nr:biopolymer transporter ExbD [Gallionella sp.]